MEQHAQEWIESDDDTFEFEVRRAPEDRELGKGPSKETLEGLKNQMAAFVLARLVARTNNGRQAQDFTVRVTVEDPSGGVGE